MRLGTESEEGERGRGGEGEERPVLIKASNESGFNSGSCVVL